MPPILELRNVCAFYNKALILDNVSLEVSEGESVALLGRNGVGKTTLVNSVFAIPRVASGSILIDGHRLSGRRKYEAAEHGVAVVPQGRRILGRLTVEENLRLGATPRRKGAWDLRAVYDLFPVLGDRSRANGQALSGGQLQMLAVGRALMANPRLILLDEPFEGLAPVIVQQLRAALRAVRDNGTTMLIVEQRIEAIAQLTERYVVMTKGRVARVGLMGDVDSERLRQQLVL